MLLTSLDKKLKDKKLDSTGMLYSSHFAQTVFVAGILAKLEVLITVYCWSRNSLMFALREQATIERHVFPGFRALVAYCEEQIAALKTGATSAWIRSLSVAVNCQTTASGVCQTER